MEAETCKKELLIEIPVDVVQRESESVAGQFAKRARIPGFRPGRAPTSLVQRHFRDDIRSEVAQTLIPRYFQNAVKEQHWEVVGEPRFEDLKFEDAQPLTCKAAFEIYPQFELPAYKGIEVEEAVPAVTDADVEKAVAEVAETAATFEVVERPAADGDYVTISYQGQDAASPDGPPASAKEAEIQLGAKHTVQEFSDNLRGAAPGEVREFSVPYPADYPQKSLAGKTYRYRAEVQSIKIKVVPSVDDDLAKSVSEFATLEELRAKMRQDLEKEAQQKAEAGTKQKLAELLLKDQTFPVPGAMVEVQLDRNLERTLGQLLAQGIDPRQAQVDWRQVRENSRGEAEKQVRVGMILDRMAEVEKIDVTEEELDEVIRDMAQAERRNAAEVKTRLTRDGKLDRLRSTRRNQKALDFIYRNAQITRINAAPPDPVAEPADSEHEHDQSA